VPDKNLPASCQQSVDLCRPSTHIKPSSPAA